ncbi:MAG TPA: sodium:solute symporter family protein [Vicinamibacterales bacterium]
MAYILVIVVYAVAQVALGAWIARRVRGAGDFFVAGRALGPGVLAATLLAANIGGGSTVGAAGAGFRNGLAAWWWVGSAAIGSAVLAMAFGPRLRRIAAAHDLRTVGDFLEWRYDQRVRAVVAVLLWAGAVFILAGQLLAMAAVLGTIAGLGRITSCAIGAIVATTYFAAGGLKSSVAVNVLQLGVKLLGFAVAVPLALAAVGGLAGLHQALPSGPYWSVWRNGGSGWIYVATLAPAFVVSPGILQKVYAGRDDRAVRIGVGLNALVLLLFAPVPPMLGMIARALHPGLAASDNALPLLFAADLPFAVGALGLAAIFSAEVSAADALLFMLATSFSQDIYRRFVNRAAGDADLVWWARAAAVAGSVMAFVLATAVARDVIDALSVFYMLLGVSLFVPIVAGLVSGRGDGAAALCAVAGGVATAAGVQWHSGSGPVHALTPPMWGIAVAAIAYMIAAAVMPRRIA